MDIIAQLVRKIKKCRIDNPDQLLVLIGKLQTHKDINQETKASDLIFFGLALGLEKVSDYRTSYLSNDSLLNELGDKIENVVKREGLGENGFYKIGDPSAPEDYNALNIEYDHRLNELTAEVMKEFGENEMTDLFLDNTKEYFRRLHSGWRILEKDNPEVLKEIDEHEKEELDEFL